jgi:hypothetical protein
MSDYQTHEQVLIKARGDFIEASHGENNPSRWTTCGTYRLSNDT